MELEEGSPGKELGFSVYWAGGDTESLQVTYVLSL